MKESFQSYQLQNRSKAVKKFPEHQNIMRLLLSTQTFVLEVAVVVTVIVTSEGPGYI